MATRLGPRSLTVQTPSRVCATCSSVLGMQLVADFADAGDLARGRRRAALRVLGVDVALERDYAGIVAVDVDLHRLQADVGGERALHLAGQRGALGRPLGLYARLLCLLLRLFHGLAVFVGEGGKRNQQGETNRNRFHQLPPEGARAWITSGLSMGGLRISCSRLGRSRRSKGSSSTGRPLSAERYRARMTRTSARPSSAPGSGSRLIRMQSEK